MTKARTLVRVERERERERERVTTLINKQAKKLALLSISKTDYKHESV